MGDLRWLGRGYWWGDGSNTDQAVEVTIEVEHTCLVKILKND